MTATVAEQPASDGATGGDRERGSRFSVLQKWLLGLVVFYFGSVPIFWYLDVHAGLSQDVASSAMTLRSILCFGGALALPWMRLPGQGPRTRSQRLDGTIITWIFIALTPRFIWELPWLFFLDEIRQGVEDEALWSYLWAAYLQGGDARYLSGDPLIVTLEWIAVFVGAFELYALWQFFRNGKRFTVTQLGFIMGGMIVEVTLPAVYFGTEIANSLESVGSTADLWLKFVLLNSFWCILPLITFGWGLRRVANNDLAVPHY